MIRYRRVSRRSRTPRYRPFGAIQGGDSTVIIDGDHVEFIVLAVVPNAAPVADKRARFGRGR